MENTKVMDLFEYRNSVKMHPAGKEQELVWNNNAMMHAEAASKNEYHSEKGAGEIIGDLVKGKLQSVILLLYGARKAADPSLKWASYQIEFHFDFLKEYIAAVKDGMEHYLPEAKEEIESCTGTEEGAESGSNWAELYYIAKTEFGMSDEEFGRNTQRSLTILLSEHLNKNRPDSENKEASDDALSWL